MPINDREYSLVAEFVVNKSGYEPDKNVDVNIGKRTYVK